METTSYGTEEGGFLAVLQPEEAAALKAAGRPRRFGRGAVIFSEGENSDRVALITSGRVKISYFTEDGREIVLAVRASGDLVGELSALDGDVRSGTTTAIDQVDTVVIPAEAFRSFLETNPRVALLLLAMLARRQRDADRKRVEFGAYDVVGRVARRLVELSERFGEDSGQGLHINLPLSQQELAGWTGASREAVSKALQTLRDRGWIETHRRGITVLDIDALSRRAT